MHFSVLALVCLCSAHCAHARVAQHARTHARTHIHNSVWGFLALLLATCLHGLASWHREGGGRRGGGGGREGSTEREGERDKTAIKRDQQIHYVASLSAALVS
jgi:hypothetical protein